MKKRIFTLKDQNDFANISGDYNPLHLDFVFARRLLYGRPIAHGMHAVLWALDSWLINKKEKIALREIKIDFFAPIPVLESVRSEILKDARNNQVKIKIDVNGIKAVIIKVFFSSGDFPVHDGSNIFNQRHSTRGECKSIPVNSLNDIEGTVDLYLSRPKFKRMFPSLDLFSSPIQISELMAITRIVGMECPGMNSIFSGMSLIFSEQVNSVKKMSFSVSKFDERFSLLQLKINGPDTTGKIMVFYRPSPKQQPNFIDLKKYVSKNEFSDRRAVVIGGSRGLGEVTAKLLAAGGAEVQVTYNVGSQEALDLVEEITSNGGTVRAIKFDVLSPPLDLKMRLGEEWTPSHLYYFASPFIFDGIQGIFSSKLYDRFCNYYVKGFVDTIQVFNKIGSRLEEVFYPSSVAIDEMPLDMVEYVASKISGETICEFLNRNGKTTNYFFTRLPRLDTDQTATLSKVENLDPLPYVLDIIKGVHSS